VQAVGWAQAFALANRELGDGTALGVLRQTFADFEVGEMAVNCHHNYVAAEEHFGRPALAHPQGRGARHRRRPQHHFSIDTIPSARDNSHAQLDGVNAAQHGWVEGE
jgi:RNA-splicing ligase RtcB